MERKHTRKMNNRGFSIVELLIVMAIAGVVTILVGGLMINGSQWYTGETAKADLQNSVQTTNTKLQKTLMEATTLNIKKEGEVLYILTGELDADNNWTSESNPNNTAKAIMIYDNHLYIADEYVAPATVQSAGEDSDLRGYEVTEYLQDGTFTVKVKNTLTTPEGSAETIAEAPIVVEISYVLEKNKKTTRSSYEVTLRNSEVMKKIYAIVDDTYKEITVK